MWGVVVHVWGVVVHVWGVHVYPIKDTCYTVQTNIISLFSVISVQNKYAKHVKNKTVTLHIELNQV